MISTQNTARRLQIDEINRYMRDDADGFIAAECARYREEIREVEDWLNDEAVRRRVVLLSGPTSSGKTTTANLLCAALHRNGADARVVSLDNFYRAREETPRLPDGTYDLETPEALNLPLLASCIADLLERGRASLPEYDFHTQRPKPEKVDMTLGGRSVVIFEGIHALHPLLRDQLPKKHVKRLLVHAQSVFCDEVSEVLTQREIRLVRRMVRDERFRNSTPTNTMSMWPQVVHGEETYLFPYLATADRVIDTTHAFEPCMFAERLPALLNTVSPDHPQYAAVHELMGDIARFVPVSTDHLPADSVLQEFLGNG